MFHAKVGKYRHLCMWRSHFLLKTQEESTQNITINGTRDSQSTTQNLDPDKEFLIRSSFRLGGRIEGAVMPYYDLIFF